MNIRENCFLLDDTQMMKADATFWSQATEQLRQFGWRRLLVLSGDIHWCQQQLRLLQQQISGDWCYFSLEPEGVADYTAQTIHNLLGQEINHAVFDCHLGFHAEALAILAGALRAGSWLVMLAPAWHSWPQQQDIDSQRWQDQGKMSSTPHFIHYLQTTLLAYSPEVLCYQQGLTWDGKLLPDSPTWQPLTDAGPTWQQQQLLQRIITSPQRFHLLTAARGRGKSSLAAWLINSSTGQCWVTAPNKRAISSLLQHCQQPITFFAPDQLLAHCVAQGDTACRSVSWLIIDEAAMIPISLLNQLVQYFPRVLLLTTMQGYEGTGQGFILKFCQQLRDYQLLELQQPIRWANNDPLEACINTLFLFDYSSLISKPPLVSLANQSMTLVDNHQLAEIRQDYSQLQAFYQLLVQAHYRTTPLDWRRLLDANNILLASAKLNQQLIAAVWLQREGGLSSSLAKAVWAGERRPRGNLVAQSLAAYAGVYQAAEQVSYRISRLAVDLAYRRQGVAKQLIQQQIDHHYHQSQVDYLSASFALTDQLAAFWQACGWQIVYIGHRQDHISGSYQAIALYPISLAGKHLVNQLVANFQRDGQLMAWHPQWQAQRNYWQTTDLSSNFSQMMPLDWQNLLGFSAGKRALSVSLAVIYRFFHRHLLSDNDGSLMLLNDYILLKINLAQAIKQSGCHSKQQLIGYWRQQLLQMMQRVATTELTQCWSWSQD